MKFQKEKDIYYMEKALELALTSLGKTSPNPAVGAVIVKDKKIIGQGATQPPGQNHAEVEAIINASESVKDSEMYVTLEPCNHYGRTPPCTEKIIQSGIRRVIIAAEEPNPAAKGGIKKMREHGIEVVTGVLKKKAERINDGFFMYHNNSRPFTAVKAALSLDGKIALKSGFSKWISNPESRKKTHLLRSRYDAILVGANTLIKDNPSLTVRMVEGRNPLRIILAHNLEIPTDRNVFQIKDNTETIVYCTEEYNKETYKKLKDMNIKVIPLPSSEKDIVDMKYLMKDLYLKKILSVFVEGGQKIITSFIKSEFADKAYFFITPKIIGNDGIAVVGDMGQNDMKKIPHLDDIQFTQFEDNILMEGYFSYS